MKYYTPTVSCHAEDLGLLHSENSFSWHQDMDRLSLSQTFKRWETLSTVGNLLLVMSQKKSLFCNRVPQEKSFSELVATNDHVCLLALFGSQPSIQYCFYIELNTHPISPQPSATLSTLQSMLHNNTGSVLLPSFLAATSELYP